MREQNPDRQTDRQRYIQTDRQTDRQTELKYYIDATRSPDVYDDLFANNNNEGFYSQNVYILPIIKH